MNLSPAELKRLLAEEPFVRALARSLLADEAEDVVQQTWLRAIEARPSGLRDVRAWLAALVRNLVVDLRRRRARRTAHEAAAVASPRVPSSADLALAEEQRRELVAAVDALPEHLRTVVLLRWFEGLPPRRIARQLGVPVSVVWNRLHAALSALRRRLDDRHGGDRLAWALPLVPFAESPRALPWRELVAPGALASWTTGVIAMSSNGKVVCVAVLAASVLLAWLLWSPAPPPQPTFADAGALVPQVAAAVDPAVEAGDSGSPGPARRVASEAATASSAGELEVVVRHADESKAVTNVLVVARSVGRDLRLDSRHSATDASGTARFTGLEAGTYLVRAHGLHARGQRVDVHAGACSKATLQVTAGCRLEGLVVDDRGAPVGGASIELVPSASSDQQLEVVATSAADGTFVLEDCFPFLLVGARASGYASSQLHSVRGDQAPTARVRIELRTAGGSVEGSVVDASGLPVPGAVVRVGEGQRDSIRSTVQGAPAAPAQVCSDAAGRFHAVGVPVGAQPLWVRAAGMAPWRGDVHVLPSGTAVARVTMTPGTTVRGVVRDERGQPMAEAKVRVGAPGTFLGVEAESAVDGTFVLRGLAAGEIEVVASRFELGEGRALVRGEPGGDVRCEVVVSAGQVLRGRVLDEAGAPLSAIPLRCTAEGPGPVWLRDVRSDERGDFSVTECPPARTLVVSSASAGRLPWHRAGIDPRAGAIEVRLSKDTTPRARIVGRVLLPDGHGAVGASVEAIGERLVRADAKVTDPSGSFVLEVGQGTWSIDIAAEHHPRIRRDARRLAPGESWDLGTLQIESGGTLLVRQRPAAKVAPLVVDLAERFVCGFHPPSDAMRSTPLAAGGYLLLIAGPGIAAKAVPFEIQVGVETVLDVVTDPGVPVRLQFVPQAGEDLRSVYYSLRRDGHLVAMGFTDQGAGVLHDDVFLAAGEYELVTRERPLVTTRRLSVQPGATEPVRIDLR